MPANYIGTLKGDFSVASTGGAVYSLPLRVPPGIGQAAPQLGIAYNSAGSHDLLLDSGTGGTAVFNPARIAS